MKSVLKERKKRGLELVEGLTSLSTAVNFSLIPGTTYGPQVVGSTTPHTYPNIHIITHICTKTKR